MTALDRYERLESEALWRAGPDVQRRDVTISFGDATLVIADGAGRPLAHWSLPALIRQNPGEEPATYVPDEDASEELEIADNTMVEAIEEVRKALAKSRPHPGKLRHWLTGGIILITLLLAVFWLPGALTRQTLAVVPGPKRAEIGQTMLGFVQSETGTVCQSPRADEAARRLATRIFGPDTTNRIVVVPDLMQGAMMLPGGLIALDYGVLQGADDPAAAAGFVLASMAHEPSENPMERMLDSAGLSATFRLLTTGDVPIDVLRQTAMTALNDPAPIDPARLRRALADAQIAQAPYLATVDGRTGSMPDLGADPLADRALPLILNDSDWVALQNVCNA